MTRRRRVHLELLAKPRLVQIARESSERAEAEARSSEVWRRIVRETFDGPRAVPSVHVSNPQAVTRAAVELLRRLPRDPDAAEHRRVLVEHAIHPLNRTGRRQEAS